MATFFVYKDTGGYFRWQCRATNGRIVADSGEGYANKSDCINGIRIVRSEPGDMQDLT